MDLFKSFFSTTPTFDDPKHISFGRYSDAYKDSNKYEAWDVAIEAFNQNDYLNTYTHFFKYLTDDRKKNVEIVEKNGSVFFKIYQGSKMLIGEATNSFFMAESKIAKVKSYNIAFLRRLLELNYSLKYCRYALDPADNLTMVFYSKTIDASPYKIYYALKELATQSDKQDDILEGEFDTLQSIHKDHIRSIDEDEKTIKYDFFHKTIRQALDVLENTSLNLNNYPGAESFVLLDAAYKLDYLIKPEGFIMETIEKVHRKFFESNGQNAVVKNNILRKQLANLLDRPRKEFDDELYEVVSTFGITMPTGHDRFVELLDANSKNIDWYQKEGHDKIAEAIASYIVGYCLFNYSLPAPIAALLHLYYRIMEESYFVALGFKERYWNIDALSKKQITVDIKEIVENYKREYGLRNADMNILNFSDRLLFAKSFLKMLREIQTLDKSKPA